MKIAVVLLGSVAAAVAGTGASVAVVSSADGIEPAGNASSKGRTLGVTAPVASERLQSMCRVHIASQLTLSSVADACENAALAAPSLAEYRRHMEKAINCRKAVVAARALGAALQSGDVFVFYHGDAFPSLPTGWSLERGVPFRSKALGKYGAVYYLEDNARWAPQRVALENERREASRLHVQEFVHRWNAQSRAVRSSNLDAIRRAREESSRLRRAQPIDQVALAAAKARIPEWFIFGFDYDATTCEVIPPSGF